VPYTADKPPLPESVESLRARIPGWGADLDPRDRPSWPREWSVETQAPWAVADHQQPVGYRERSVEHGAMPAVFGTTAPLHGVSGRIRRRAYDRYSEARATHWLLLIMADRVEAAGSRLPSVASLTSKGQRQKAPQQHQHGEPVPRLGVAGLQHIALGVAPWLLGAGALGLVVRRLTR